MNITDKIKWARELADLGPADYEDVITLTRTFTQERGAAASAAVKSTPSVEPAETPKPPAEKPARGGRKTKTQQEAPTTGSTSTSTEKPESSASTAPPEVSAPSRDGVDEAMADLDSLDT